MSRGPGRVQREIYDALPFPKKRWIPVSDLYGPDATPARKEAVRRAVRGLARRGLVEVSWRDRPPGSGAGGRIRIARLALNDAERVAERRALAALDALMGLPPGHDALGLSVVREPHE